MWLHYLGEDYDREKTSPYAAPNRATEFSGLPPAIVWTNGLDPLRDEGIEYAMNLMAAGIDVELYNCPGRLSRRGSARCARGGARLPDLRSGPRRRALVASVSGDVRGLRVEPVSTWLHETIEGLSGALRFELVAAGGSNLTYRVVDEAGRIFVLRRPPERARIATAHEMGREWKILSALHAHPEAGIPVPEALAYCDDADVTGAEFYAMGFADGLILRGPEEAAGMDAAACDRAADSLIDVQIAMARVDPDAIGLGDLGRRERQDRRDRDVRPSGEPAFSDSLAFANLRSAGCEPVWSRSLQPCAAKAAEDLVPPASGCLSGLQFSRRRLHDRGREKPDIATSALLSSRQFRGSWGG